MRVGFILECGPEGAETRVVPLLARMTNPRLKVDGRDVVPLSSKPVMKHSCGTWAKALL